MQSPPSFDILVVDDNAADRAVYRRSLSKSTTESFQIREAETGAEALGALAQAVPDIVLLDFHLPDATGIELLTQIRAHNLHLPVIMLTGLDDVSTSVAAIQSGADDYQIKGKLGSDSLLRAIRGALDKRALQVQLARERERLELFYKLLERSNDMLLVIAMPEARLIEFNQACLTELGYPAEVLRDPGADLAKVFPHVHEVWATLTPEAPDRRLRCEAIRADGVVLPLEVSASCVEQGGKAYFVAVCRDIRDRVEMEAQLRRLVLLDALTGVHNRRALDERMEQEFARAARGHGSLGLLMIDIDHFKAYNDHYGHPAGDKCLRQVAQAMSAALKRPSDFLARYGGEEFAVLLPDARLADVQGAAEMLLARVRELALPHVGSVRERVSISIGACVATPPVRGQMDQFVAEADRQLYRAKQAGRDRVMCGDVPFMHTSAEPGPRA